MTGDREVFRGHLDECLRHLAARLESRFPKGAKGLTKARLPIATFCGVAERTVERWLSSSDIMPVGEQHLKLMCFLDLQGYRVIELERMKRGRRGFSELIAFGLLSVEQANQTLGYKNIQDVYSVLQGRQGTSEEKDQKMWDAWKERKEELAKKKEEARDRYRLDWLEPSPAAKSSSVVEPAHVAHELDPRATAALSIMQGLLRLLEDGTFKNLKPRELKTLQRTGGETIPRLSAQLSTLSSALIMLDQPKSRGGS